MCFPFVDRDIEVLLDGMTFFLCECILLYIYIYIYELYEVILFCSSSLFVISLASDDKICWGRVRLLKNKTAT